MNKEIRGPKNESHYLRYICNEVIPLKEVYKGSNEGSKKKATNGV